MKADFVGFQREDENKYCGTPAGIEKKSRGIATEMNTHFSVMLLLPAVNKKLSYC